MGEKVALRLGSLALDVPFFQASLSGYSDYPMRMFARRYGCPFAMADVMLDKSVARPDILAKACFRPRDDEHPVGAQILGKTPETMAQAATALVGAGYDLIDINCACPAPKVMRRGRGGALLEKPDVAIEILKAVRDSVSCPVMMKLRIGTNRSSQAQEKFWEIVERAIGQGVDALVIHGRTVCDRYRGRADWGILAEVKRRFPKATIVASGDVFDAQASLNLLRQTGLDGFVVARGAIGNPWIFKELRCLWEGGDMPAAPAPAEQKGVLLEHLGWVCQGYPELRAVGYFRKFLIHYVRRHPRRKQLVQSLLKAKARKEVEAVIEEWYAEGLETKKTQAGR